MCLYIQYVVYVYIYIYIYCLFPVATCPLPTAHCLLPVQTISSPRGNWQLKKRHVKMQLSGLRQQISGLSRLRQQSRAIGSGANAWRVTIRYNLVFQIGVRVLVRSRSNIIGFAPPSQGEPRFCFCPSSHGDAVRQQTNILEFT